MFLKTKHTTTHDRKGIVRTILTITDSWVWPWLSCHSMCSGEFNYGIGGRICVCVLTRSPVRGGFAKNAISIAGQSPPHLEAALTKIKVLPKIQNRTPAGCRPQALTLLRHR